MRPNIYASVGTVSIGYHLWMDAKTERPTTCPICGKGTLADIEYNEGQTSDDDLQQQPESRQLDVYTCGHRVPGARLESADDRLDVERRTSEETAEPLPENDKR